MVASHLRREGGRRRLLVVVSFAFVVIAGQMTLAPHPARSDEAAVFRLAIAAGDGVYVANGDGSAMRRVATLHAGSQVAIAGGSVAGASWSPDGSEIV